MAYYNPIAMKRHERVMREYGSTPMVYNGTALNLFDWAHKLKVTPSTMADRLIKLHRGEWEARQVFAPNMNKFGKPAPEAIEHDDRIPF